MAQVKNDGPPYGPMDNRGPVAKGLAILGGGERTDQNLILGAAGQPPMTAHDFWNGSTMLDPNAGVTKKRGGRAKKKGIGKVHGGRSMSRLDKAPRKGGGTC